MKEKGDQINKLRIELKEAEKKLEASEQSKDELARSYSEKTEGTNEAELETQIVIILFMRIY